jgi:trans-aconitate methyltransferase
MDADNAWNFAYRTNERHGEDFLTRVQNLVGEELSSGPRKVLEVGCGDGGKAIRLAESWPSAHFTGVDISEPSICLATQNQQASPARERLRFLTGDYLAMSLGQYDLILADSVLQWIPGSTDGLFGKLAGDLNPGGLLVFSIPYACLYNSILTGIRQTLRLFRSSLLDQSVLALARIIHGRSHTSEFLRERLSYAYRLTQRMASPALMETLRAQHDLAAEAIVPYAHASPGQFKHQLWCFRYQPQRAKAA